MDPEEARRQAKEELAVAAAMNDSDTASVGEAYDAIEDYILHVPKLAKMVLALAEEVERLQQENRQLHEFVEHVNETLPNLNSRFEEWLT